MQPLDTVLDAETPVTQKLTTCSKWNRITLGIATSQSLTSHDCAFKVVEQEDLSKIPALLLFFSPRVVGVTGKNCEPFDQKLSNIEINFY